MSAKISVNCAVAHRIIVPHRYPIRPRAILATVFLVAALVCPGARGADKDKDKKPEKEKKEKIEPWVEVRTAHFIVASDGGEKTARRFADEFESLLRIFQSTMPKSRVTTSILGPGMIFCATACFRPTSA